MTRISKKIAYPIKKPSVNDYFTGTNSEDTLKTVSFSFDDTVSIINEVNGTSVLKYRFENSYNINLSVLTEGIFLSSDNETLISNVSKLFINKKNLQEYNLSNLFEFISFNKDKFIIKLRGADDTNNVLYFNILSVTNFTDYFTIDVSVYLSNPTIPNLIHFKDYFLGFELKGVADVSGLATITYVDEKDTEFKIAIKDIVKANAPFTRANALIRVDALGRNVSQSKVDVTDSGSINIPEGESYLVGGAAITQDKKFRFSQVVPELTWNINHNLGKFPAVIIMDYYGVEYESSIKHTNINNLTISFSNPFSGYADLN
jgi:hypothetical protein